MRLYQYTRCFEMKTQRLISSYDEVNDIFYGMIEGKKGYLANYAVDESIFINIGDGNYPVSFLISNASNVLDVKKEVLEESNVKIAIGCDDLSLYFNMCINNVEIYKDKFKNLYSMPNFSFILDTNY